MGSNGESKTSIDCLAEAENIVNNYIVRQTNINKINFRNKRTPAMKSVKGYNLALNIIMMFCCILLVYAVKCLFF